MPLLKTERLAIVPLTAQLVRAALEDRAELGKLLLARVPESWPGADFADLLPYLADLYAMDPEQSKWTGLIVHSVDRVLIGDIGFKGPPDRQGAVEIGYSIVPEYRGKGFATEAVKAMIDWALQQPGVTWVIAECLQDNASSARVLEKAGMRQTGTSGDLLHWEYVPSVKPWHS